MEPIKYQLFAKSHIEILPLIWRRCIVIYEFFLFTFSKNKLQYHREKLERIPCASLLVRINQAPLSEDGLRTLCIEDFPNQIDWEKKGLVLPRPHYGTGSYNTSLCPVRDSEKELFVVRQTRYEPKIRDQAYIMIKSEGISRQMVSP